MLILFKKNNFSSNAHISSIQKDIGFKYKKKPMSQTSIKIIEDYKAPIGNYSHTTYLEKKQKFNIYIYNLKLKLYFYNVKNTKKNFINIILQNDVFLLKSTKNEIEKINSNSLIKKIDIFTLSKYLFFYFSFYLPISWYKQPKIIRYIQRLYFFETGYRYKSKLSDTELKNIYSHALFNSILRLISLEKKNSKNFDNYLHPFLEKIKIILLQSKNKNNLEIIISFFNNLVSSEFLKDNYIFLKEFESDLIHIIDKEHNNELKNNKNKIKIFLINFFIKDFLLFLNKKENFKYLNYDKKIFNIKREPHSFFLIPK